MMTIPLIETPPASIGALPAAAGAPPCIDKSAADAFNAALNAPRGNEAQEQPVASLAHSRDLSPLRDTLLASAAMHAFGLPPSKAAAAMPAPDVLRPLAEKNTSVETTAPSLYGSTIAPSPLPVATDSPMPVTAAGKTAAETTMPPLDGSAIAPSPLPVAADSLKPVTAVAPGVCGAASSITGKAQSGNPAPISTLPNPAEHSLSASANAPMAGDDAAMYAFGLTPPKTAAAMPAPDILRPAMEKTDAETTAYSPYKSPAAPSPLPAAADSPMPVKAAGKTAAETTMPPLDGSAIAPSPLPVAADSMKPGTAMAPVVGYMQENGAASSVTGKAQADNPIPGALLPNLAEPSLSASANAPMAGDDAPIDAFAGMMRTDAFHRETAAAKDLPPMGAHAIASEAAPGPVPGKEYAVPPQGAVQSPGKAKVETREEENGLPPNPLSALPFGGEVPPPPAVVQDTETKTAGKVEGTSLRDAGNFVVGAANEIANAILVSPGLMKGDCQIRIMLKADVLDGTAIEINSIGRNLNITFAPATANAALLIEGNIALLERVLSSRVHSMAISVNSKRTDRRA